MFLNLDFLYVRLVSIITNRINTLLLSKTYTFELNLTLDSFYVTIYNKYKHSMLTKHYK